MKHYPAFFTLALSAFPLFGAPKDAHCAPEPAAYCYGDDCTTSYCLGPDNYGANAPVRPYTCNGDIELTVAGLYWTSHQDGMEYAITTEITSDLSAALVSAHYNNPHFDWEFGFKAGLSYNGACDGWDTGLMWTWYQGSAFSHNSSDSDDNTKLLTLWSDFLSATPGVALFANEIDATWDLELNLIDLDLGRMFWNSRRLSLRPHVGVRVGSIKQAFLLEHAGGLFVDVRDEANIHNDFKGAGIRVGLDSVWTLGCGWGVYGDFAFSGLNGRFHVKQDEMYRDIASPFAKHKVMEIRDTFCQNVLMADLGLGIRYQTLLADCEYALSVALGFEQHLFLNQNQMWRIVLQEGGAPTSLNSIYHQRRGDLSVSGWTLRVTFDF